MLANFACRTESDGTDIGDCHGMKCCGRGTGGTNSARNRCKFCVGGTLVLGLNRAN